MKFLILLTAVLLLSISSEVSADLVSLEEVAALCNQAEFTEAISVYKQIIKDNPKRLDAYLNLAYLYKDLAEYEQATGVIREALKFLEDSRLRMLLGRLHYLDGKPEQAIPHFNQLLAVDSADSQALFYLGLCFEDISQFTEAQASYSDVVRLQPNNVLAHLKLGDMYYQEQRFKQAIQSYQEVISLDPSITEVRSKLAECFTKLGKFQQAYKQYAKYVAIHPEDKLSQRNLGKIKAKLGDNFFQQEQKLALQRRRKKSIQVKASRFAKRASQVRVGIAKIKGSIEFKCGSPFEIIDKQSNKCLFEGREESIYSLVFNKNKTGAVGNAITGKANISLKNYDGKILQEDLDKPFLIRNNSEDTAISFFDIPIGFGNFWAGWRDQQYRGIIEVVPEGNGFWLINLVNLEEYLYGVLPSEMPADWPSEALCAQAIAARTWAIKNKARHSEQGFNFCSTVHCQVYKGAGTEMQVTNQAVDDTVGVILSCNNQPIDIFYSNNCGGCTRAGVVDAPSLDFDFPLSPLELERWLMGKPNTFCNLKDERLANFRWVRLYKQEQLQAILDNSDINIGEPLEVIPQRRAISGHLLSIKIKGTDASQVIEGENNIRKILGNLLSSAFKIEVKYNHQNQPAEFIFYGAGFGHGEGLCQRGVKGMALEGYNYRQILKHYYPDVEIGQIY